MGMVRSQIGATAEKYLFSFKESLRRPHRGVCSSFKYSVTLFLLARRVESMVEQTRPCFLRAVMFF